MGVLDADGYLRITGRLKEMVIRGGENIYPAEIEAYLATHPKVAQAAVFGVPDEKFGEELGAWIELVQQDRREILLVADSRTGQVRLLGFRHVGYLPLVTSLRSLHSNCGQRPASPWRTGRRPARHGGTGRERASVGAEPPVQPFGDESATT